MILDVKVGEMTWTIPLNRRITILRGNSGCGKTELVSNIASQNQAVQVQCQLPCIVVTATTWEIVMSASKKSLIILDDLEIVGTSRFVKLLKETESSGNFYLIVSRELMGFDNLGMLNIAVSSILRLVTDESGLHHMTEPYFLLENIKATESESVDYVVIEDSGNGKKFFKNLFKTKSVISANGGKSGVVSTVHAILANEPKAVIFLLVDMAAFGCHMDELYDTCSQINIYVKIDYECFEELLLNTNFCRSDKLVINEFEDISDKANDYMSWETYFEDLLLRVTKDKPFETGHAKKLNFCWKSNCSDCKRMQSRHCEYFLQGDKTEALLSGTKYSVLLKLR